MMRHLLATAALLALLLPAGCKKEKVHKDVADYVPKLTATGAQVLPDGSIEVTAEVQSEGTLPLAVIGFCADTVHEPGAMRNQVLTDTLFGNAFRGYLLRLPAQKTYYIRAFAANANGFTYSNEISVFHTGMAAVPCTPPLNSLTVDGIPDQVLGTGPGAAGWSYNVRCNMRDLDLEFGAKPTSGIYSISPATTLNPTRVAVSLSGVEVSYSQGNPYVYVQELGNSTYEMTLCGAKTTGGREVTTRFRVTD